MKKQKKIEKIKINKTNTDDTISALIGMPPIIEHSTNQKNIKILVEKVNEIIDYLNGKR